MSEAGRSRRSTPPLRLGLSGLGGIERLAAAALLAGMLWLLIFAVTG